MVLSHARTEAGKLSLDIETIPGQAESEVGGEFNEVTYSAADDTCSTNDPKWSYAHAVLVLCLIARACGSSNEEVVEALVTSLQFEGVLLGHSLEESMLRALALIPQVDETATSDLTDDAVATADSNTDASDGTAREHGALSHVLGRELSAMERGGIRHGHGYEF